MIFTPLSAKRIAIIEAYLLYFIRLLSNTANVSYVVVVRLQ
jgi:hypothetical protein